MDFSSSKCTKGSHDLPLGSQQNRTRKPCPTKDLLQILLSRIRQNHGDRPLPLLASPSSFAQWKAGDLASDLREQAFCFRWRSSGREPGEDEGERACENMVNQKNTPKKLYSRSKQSLSCNFWSGPYPKTDLHGGLGATSVASFRSASFGPKETVNQCGDGTGRALQQVHQTGTVMGF